MNMELDKDHSIVVWSKEGGGLFQTTGWHASLFDLLEKFGIKSSPVREYVMWTTSIPGTYTLNYGSGTYITVTSVTSSTSIKMESPKLEEPVAPKDYGRPDKEMRRQWRNSEKMHSRNTGRKIGRR